MKQEKKTEKTVKKNYYNEIDYIYRLYLTGIKYFTLLSTVILSIFQIVCYFLILITYNNNHSKMRRERNFDIFIIY